MTALEELAVARQEIQQLRAVVAKDAEQIAALQSETKELRAAIQALERVTAAAERVILLQEKALGTYQKLAAAEGERADRAIARAERLEQWSWIGPLLGVIAGAAGVAILRW